MKLHSAFVCFILMLSLFNFTAAVTTPQQPKQPKQDSPWFKCWKACQDKSWACISARGCSRSNLSVCGTSCRFERLKCEAGCEELKKY